MTWLRYRTINIKHIFVFIASMLYAVWCCWLKQILTLTKNVPKNSVLMHIDINFSLPTIWNVVLSLSLYLPLFLFRIQSCNSLLVIAYQRCTERMSFNDQIAILCVFFFVCWLTFESILSKENIIPEPIYREGKVHKLNERIQDKIELENPEPNQTAARK